LLDKLDDDDDDIREQTVELVGKLANYGEFKSKICGGTADEPYEAEFREPIASTIPLFIRWLEHKAWPVRLQGIGIIGNLANHSEWLLKRIETHLTESTKSSSVKPSRPCFHRLFDCLKTRKSTFARRLLR
jgi:hypothetical protein